MRSYLWGLDPQKPISRYLVDQWEMADGIPSNTVNTIAQTPDGYLWIGTSSGIVRFDGVKFQTICFSQKKDNYPQDIQNLTVDRNGTLWIGGSRYLTSFDYRTGQFRIFDKKDGITQDGIRYIKEDRNGNLWIAFNSSYVNRLSDSAFTAFDSSHGLFGKKINAILEDSNGNFLFGSREDGIFSFKNEKFFKFPIADMDNVIITTMFEDIEKELWIGSFNGLFKVTPNRTIKYTTTEGLNGNHITSILEDNDRNLWIGTTKGLNRLINLPDGSIRFENLLNSVSIYYLFEDREKSLWVGTEVAGLYRLKERKFIPYEPSGIGFGDVPFSLYGDQNGNTWIATAGGKLFRTNDSRLIEVPTPQILSGIGITAIAEDAQENLWFGTIGKGVFQKKSDLFFQITTREGLADNVVISIYRDSRENLWFCTFDGISVLRSRDGIIESFKSTDGLPGKEFHNVYESRNGDILITGDNGILILPKDSLDAHFSTNIIPEENEKIFLWPPKTVIRGVSSTCIYEEPESPGVTESIFWIATQGEGLKRLKIKEGKIVSFVTVLGMTNDSIYQFLEDLQGNFWLTGNYGIIRVSKGELNSRVFGGIDKINCTYFGKSDGMDSLEFDNKFSRNSVLKTSDGEFWFITKKGITTVNPDKIRINQILPPIVVESLDFGSQSISIHPEKSGKEPFTFKGVTDVRIYFTAPTFLSPEKVRFKYRLENFDTQWVALEPGQGRMAYYKKLLPGKYIFRVIGCNADGVWNLTGDSVSFVLEPIFIQSIVFKLIVLFFIITLIVVVFYFYRKQSLLKKIKYKDSPLSPDFAGENIQKLTQLMENEKIYADAEISLQSLADRMSISPHLLSQLINEKLDRNFFDFINKYRVEAAIKILQSPSGTHRKISAIAMEVGFNTMAAFYKAFKKHTGKTPSWYQKEMRNKK